MIRTEAPKDLEGRGLLNLARTTPELPGKINQLQLVDMSQCRRNIYREGG